MRWRDLHTFLFATLRGRLILGVALVHAVMMTLFIADLISRQRALLLERQQGDATALVRSLATSGATWLAAADLAGLQELVEAQKGNPELLFAMLADAQGRILAHTDSSRRGQFLLDLPKEAGPVMLGKDPALVDIATPAILAGRQVGWARVGLGQKAAERKLSQLIVNGALYALAAIVIGALIAWRMGRRFTERLYVVQETIAKVKGGERTARSVVRGADEAAVLASEFNTMLDTLEKQNVDLARSESRYRLLLRNIRAAVVVHAADTRILMANPVAHELLGLSEAQMFGKAAIDPAWHFLREDGSPLALADYPVNRTLAEQRPLHNLIVGIQRPDRDLPIWALVSTATIPDEQGQIGEIIVTFVDISDRKRAEDKIRRSAREWSAAMDALEDVIYLLSPERRLLRANQAFYRLTGATPATAIGKHIVELVHPGGEEIPCPVCQAQEDKRDTLLVLEPDHPHNPGGIPLEISLRVVRDEQGAVVSMLMTLHDLSHQRQIQEELTKYREHLEELVRERTAEVEKKNAELERMIRLFVGRELRMVELKERIRSLETGAGKRGAQ